MTKTRCKWCEVDDLYRDYHDNEWGQPEHNDKRLFEFLCLEGAQAGLSWHTILKKRAHYTLVFDNWDAEKIAGYNQRKVGQLLQDPGIIRNKLKVNAFIVNAQQYLRIQKEQGSFGKWIWQFADLDEEWFRPTEGKMRTTCPAAEAMSKALKKEGFKFVGPTICYAYMQATGMIDDHYDYCYLTSS